MYPLHGCGNAMIHFYNNVSATTDPLPDVGMQ